MTQPSPSNPITRGYNYVLLFCPQATEQPVGTIVCKELNTRNPERGKCALIYKSETPCPRGLSKESLG